MVGSVDILVNNPGTTRDANFKKLDKVNRDAVIRTGFRNCATLCLNPAGFLKYIGDKRWWLPGVQKGVTRLGFSPFRRRCMRTDWQPVQTVV
jgi:hypothetical protein